MSDAIDPPREIAPRRWPMRQVDRGVGVAVLAVGGLIVVTSRGLEYGSVASPGPGLLPTWLGYLLVACGAVLVAGRGPRAEEEWLVLPDRAGGTRVLGGIAMLFAFALVLETLGFLISAALVVFLSVAALAGQPLRMALIYAVTLPAFFYLVFTVWLGVRLPAGLLGL